MRVSHEEKLKQLQKEFISGSFQKDEKTHFSNTMRKKKGKTLSVHYLDEVIAIDPQSHVAWVEPSVTMQELVSATLPFGLIPPVVPEFKGITVGGAINGAALESSSHKHGQFNDNISAYEILLGDGSIIWANEKEHPELFYAISGSYGTLGRLVSAKIALIETFSSVKLTYTRFQKVQDAIRFLSEQKEPYLEAIVYGPHLTVVISGRDVPEKPNFSLQKASSPWFYQHVYQAKGEEILPIKDYLFRHDRGAFWMGGYAVDPRMSFSYFMHKISLGMQDISHYFLPSKSTPKYPGRLFRTLCGWKMGSQELYASLHGGSEEWFEKHFVIQDFYLPEESVANFILETLKKTSILPIWICPIRSTVTPQLFSPHVRAKEELLFDVGIYGYARGKGPQVVRDLEGMVLQGKGRKMLYSHSYFTKEQFWKIYPFDTYQTLRLRYQLNKMSPDITEKVLQ